MPSSGMFHRGALARTDVVFLRGFLRLLVTANDIPSSAILVALMMEAIRCSETSVLQQSQDVTSQKTEFFV
jgi:hypothetical protein